MGNKGGKIVLTDDIVFQISQSSGIETNLVQQQCENFLKNYPTGNMNRKDFKKFIKIALPKINADKMETNLFRMYDLNMDGVISMEEFLIFYHICSDGTAEENLSKIFRIFDVDNNGVISKEELKELVRDMSGVITITGAEKYSEDEITNTCWQEMDMDGDGSITCQEFIDSVLRHDKFSKLLAVSLLDMLT